MAMAAAQVKGLIEHLLSCYNIPRCMQPDVLAKCEQ